MPPSPDSPPPPIPSPDRRCAVFMAHPGHELRIHHWLELQRPAVLVLTDGSGRTNRSRLPSTERVLTAIGVKPGPIFGRYSDHRIYEHLLARDTEFFLGLARELAAFIEANNIDLLAGDAAEGYNTSHDMCRHLIDAAVGKTLRRTGRQVARYQFLLVGRPDECPPDRKPAALWLRLDEAALRRKLEAARGYPELTEEVTRTIEQHGTASFAVECLQPVTAESDVEPPVTPFYETHGERQRQAGHYHEVIRRREHMEPVRDALRAWASSAA